MTPLPHDDDGDINILLVTLLVRHHGIFILSYFFCGHRPSPRNKYTPYMLVHGVTTGKAHTTGRARDRIDSLSWVPEGAAEAPPSMTMSSMSSTTTGGLGSGTTPGLISSFSGQGFPGSLGGGGGGAGVGEWRRGYVRSASPAAQAGYGLGLVAGLEPGMGGDKRALWCCFCSFKTRRKRCAGCGGWPVHAQTRLWRLGCCSFINVKESGEEREKDRQKGVRGREEVLERHDYRYLWLVDRGGCSSAAK